MNKFFIIIGGILLITLSLVSYRYSLVGKTCLTGGCYGPLKIMLKTTTGEHVEDVIIEASLRGPGRIFCLHGLCEADIYREAIVVNTDEAFYLPRGFFVRRSKDQPKDAISFRMNYEIYHPDYQNVTRKIYVPNQQDDEIDLGVIEIVSKQVIHDRSINRDIKYWKKKGLSEEGINEKLKDKLILAPDNGLNIRYFAMAVSLKRDDIVDKYLPELLQARIAFRKKTQSFELLNKIYRDAIWKKAKEL